MARIFPTYFAGRRFNVPADIASLKSRRQEGGRCYLADYGCAGYNKIECSIPEEIKLCGQAQTRQLLIEGECLFTV